MRTLFLCKTDVNCRKSKFDAHEINVLLFKGNEFLPRDFVLVLISAKIMFLQSHPTAGGSCFAKKNGPTRAALCKTKCKTEDEGRGGRGGKADAIPNQHPRTQGSRRANERNAARLHRVTAQRVAAGDCAQNGKVAPLGINAGESPAESLRDRVRCIKASTTGK